MSRRGWRAALVVAAALACLRPSASAAQPAEAAGEIPPAPAACALARDALVAFRAEGHRSDRAFVMIAITDACRREIARGAWPGLGEALGRPEAHRTEKRLLCALAPPDAVDLLASWLRSEYGLGRTSDTAGCAADLLRLHPSRRADALAALRPRFWGGRWEVPGATSEFVRSLPADERGAFGVAPRGGGSTAGVGPGQPPRRLLQGREPRRRVGRALRPAGGARAGVASGRAAVGGDEDLRPLVRRRAPPLRRDHRHPPSPRARPARRPRAAPRRHGRRGRRRRPVRRPAPRRSGGRPALRHPDRVVHGGGPRRRPHRGGRVDPRRPRRPGGDPVPRGRRDDRVRRLRALGDARRAAP